MISAIAPAKINLTFLCGPLGADGYHEVASIYQALDFFEQVGVEPADSWQIDLISDGIQESASVPTDSSNLVIRAAEELAKFAGLATAQPMRFEIRKQVPPAGGMAGGSADAAAALLALNSAWGLGLAVPEMMKVAANIGADVPFSLLGGTALGTGTGANLEPLPALPQQQVLLVFSTPGLSTAAVFKEFDRLVPDGDLTMSSKSLQEAFGVDLESILGRNSLATAAFSLRPDLAGLAGLVPGKIAYVSGSGPTLFMISEDLSEIEQWQQVFLGHGLKTLVTQTTDRGAELIS